LLQLPAQQSCCWRQPQRGPSQSRWARISLQQQQQNQTKGGVAQKPHNHRTGEWYQLSPSGQAASKSCSRMTAGGWVAGMHTLCVLCLLSFAAPARHPRSQCPRCPATPLPCHLLTCAGYCVVLPINPPGPVPPSAPSLPVLAQGCSRGSGAALRLPACLLQSACTRVRPFAGPWLPSLMAHCSCSGAGEREHRQAAG